MTEPQKKVTITIEKGINSTTVYIQNSKIIIPLTKFDIDFETDVIEFYKEPDVIKVETDY